MGRKRTSSAVDEDVSRRAQPRKRARQLDTTLPENWTIANLTARLAESNIVVPQGFKHPQLLALYKANLPTSPTNERDSYRQPERSTGSDLATPCASLDQLAAQAQPASSVSGVNNNSAQLLENSGAVASQENNCFTALDKSLTAISSTLEALRSAVTNNRSINRVVDPFSPSNEHESSDTDNSSYTLETAKRPPSATGAEAGHVIGQGYASEDLPHVETIPSAIKKQILEEIPRIGATGRERTHHVPRRVQNHVVLSSTVGYLLETSISASTKRAYRSAISSFIRFAAMHSLPFHELHNLPVCDELTLMLYVAFCFKVKRLKYGTIQSHIYAIRHVYLATGVSHPLSGMNCCPRLYMVLRGVRKVQGSHQTRRFPITFEILSNMCLLFRAGFSSPFMDVMLECACLVAFFGFLRCGEFTTKTSLFNPRVNLTMGDISVCEQGASLLLKSSKTDPFRQGRVIQLPRVVNLCPVKCLERYISIRNAFGAKKDDPLFISSEGTSLTRSGFITSIRCALDRLGHDQSKFGGHSFRVGAATTAAKANVEDHMIKYLGRWSSSCYQRYIRTSYQSISEAHQAISHGS